MKSLHKQRGFWNFIIPAAATLIGGMMANESNEDNAENTTRFNAAEAAKNRTFNSEEAKISREFSSAQASRQMDFQERMSGTAYQRTIKDMQSAGLNPMLAYSQGGASVPSGAQGSSAQAQGSAATGVTARNENVLGPAVATALQFKQAEASIKNTEANTDVQHAQRDNVAQDTLNKQTGVDKIVAETENTKAATKNIAAQTALTEKQIEKTIQDVKESYAREDKTKAEAILAKLSAAEARAFEQYYKSIGQASPFVKFILNTLQVLRGR